MQVFVGISLFTLTRGRRTGSFEKQQEESDLINKCKCHPFCSLGCRCGHRCQECVDLILIIWFSFALTFPLLYTPLCLPCLSCCTSVSNVLNLFLHISLLRSCTVATHALLSIDLLAGSCSLLSIHLYCISNTLIARLFLSLFFPLSNVFLCLLTHYLLSLFLPP